MPIMSPFMNRLTGPNYNPGHTCTQSKMLAAQLGSKGIVWDNTANLIFDHTEKAQPIIILIKAIDILDMAVMVMVYSLAPQC